MSFVKIVAVNGHKLAHRINENLRNFVHIFIRFGQFGPGYVYKNIV